MSEATPSADFPFESHYVEVHGAKMHYVDEGEGRPIVFLHGNPTSSYLWRNVIGHVLPQGRAIAPDLIGMGKSAKPDLDYRFVDHARYLDGFIEALGLEDIALVIHDWGSALGFHYARRHPDNVRAIAFMEALVLPMPSLKSFPRSAQGAFKAFRTEGVGWQLIVEQNVFVEQVLPGAILRKLSEAEMDAYRAPYLEPAARKPVWRWPNEIPIAGEPADVQAAIEAYDAYLQQSQVPKLLLTAEPGALTRKPVIDWCRANLPNLEIRSIGAGSHFIQEDQPEAIGRAVADWLGRQDA